MFLKCRGGESSLAKPILGFQGGATGFQGGGGTKPPSCPPECNMHGLEL